MGNIVDKPGSYQCMSCYVSVWAGVEYVTSPVGRDSGDATGYTEKAADRQVLQGVPCQPVAGKTGQDTGTTERWTEAEGWTDERYNTQVGTGILLSSRPRTLVFTKRLTFDRIDVTIMSISMIPL